MDGENMKLTLRRHQDDQDMIELIQRHSDRPNTLFGVVHEDCFWTDPVLRARLRTDREVVVNVRVERDPGSADDAMVVPDSSN